MKKTLVTAALVACAATQMFAQNAKEGVLTFALTYQRQDNITTQSGKKYVGKWSQRPAFYTTKSSQKLDTKMILQDIGAVLHQNAGYYSSKAQLVFVQGELGGFFNVTEDIAAATKDIGVGTNSGIFPGKFASNAQDSTVDPLNIRLPVGRHYEAAPSEDENGNSLPDSFVGGWPPGHHQPWGQIFVKDTGYSPMLCENVTFFFAISVEECYDCFYLNSFITDATFKFKDAQQVTEGPPCCAGTIPSGLSGNGKDRYYMNLSFDNTRNNPFLNPDFPDYYVGWGQKVSVTAPFYNAYAGVVGFEPFANGNGFVDGLTPDGLPYVDNIASQLGVFNQYVLRFTLNGIVTYTWNLKLINSTDLLPDFIGTLKYPCYGYGFWGLYCSLFNGSASIAEKSLKVGSCCLDLPWYDSWYGPGYDVNGNSSQRATPVNIEPSLSYHQYWNVGYVPGEQSGSAPATDAPTGYFAE
jgi:hypothetical protein